MFDFFKTKILLIVHISVALVGVAAYGLLLWSLTFFTTQALESVEKTRTDSVRKIRIETIREAFSQTASAQAQVQSLALTDEDTVPFLDQIEALGKQAEVSVETPSVGAVPIVGSNRKISGENLQVIVVTNGTWSATYRFLRMLENLPYKSEIAHASLRQVDASDAKNLPTWKGEFTLLLLKSKK